MAWIDMISEDDADGELRELYAHHADRRGNVDHILKIHSLNPKSLRLHYDYYRHIMRGVSGLTRAEREMIAVTVSRTNGCHY